MAFVLISRAFPAVMSANVRVLPVGYSNDATTGQANEYHFILFVYLKYCNLVLLVYCKHLNKYSTVILNYYYMKLFREITLIVYYLC